MQTWPNHCFKRDSNSQRDRKRTRGRGGDREKAMRMKRGPDGSCAELSRGSISQAPRGSERAAPRNLQGY